mgnify:CR=1 FL=1
MSEAPERIFMDPDIQFPECKKQYFCDVEYVRADHVNELIAAAYEDAASMIETSTTTKYHQAQCVRARTPDDARAELAARDKRVREEALREGITKLARRFAIYSDNGQSLKAMGFSEAAEELEALITKDHINE